MDKHTEETRRRDPFWSNLFHRRPPWKLTTIEMLSQTPIFEGIATRALSQLVDDMHRRRYRDQEVVFSAGDTGLGMYLVLTGEVSISLEGSELARLRPGEFFGEVALFGEQSRTADAIAIGELELVGFFRPDLQEWVDRSPKLGSRVLMQLGRVLAERLRASNERLGEQPL
jgi:CRP-like cAMP-binding protein